MSRFVVVKIANSQMAKERNPNKIQQDAFALSVLLLFFNLFV